MPARPTPTRRTFLPPGGGAGHPLGGGIRYQYRSSEGAPVPAPPPSPSPKGEGTGFRFHGARLLAQPTHRSKAKPTSTPPHSHTPIHHTKGAPAARWLPLLLALGLLLPGRAARADGPQPLVLLPSTGGVGFAIDIENITYAKTDLSALEGTGDLI